MHFVGCKSLVHTGILKFTPIWGSCFACTGCTGVLRIYMEPVPYMSIEMKQLHMSVFREIHLHPHRCQICRNVHAATASQLTWVGLPACQYTEHLCIPCRQNLQSLYNRAQSKKQHKKPNGLYTDKGLGLFHKGGPMRSARCHFGRTRLDHPLSSMEQQVSTDMCLLTPANIRSNPIR